MQYLPISQTLASVSYTPIQCQYLNLSIIVLLEKANTLLFKAGWLAETDVESNDEEECFSNAFPNDFVETKTTWGLLDKDLLSDKDLDPYSDRKDIPQNTSSSPRYDSFESYERECMDNDTNPSNSWSEWS